MPVYLPEYIIDTLHDEIGTRLADHTILKRTLRATDPALSVGMQMVNWRHMQAESAMIGQHEPALGRYQVYIQNMVKHTDEEQGRKIHNVQNAFLRAILYRDAALRLRLLEVDEEILGSAERIKRFGVARQDFLSNKISGSFMYFCTTEMWVETEITALNNV